MGVGFSESHPQVMYQVRLRASQGTEKTKTKEAEVQSHTGTARPLPPPKLTWPGTVLQVSYPRMWEAEAGGSLSQANLLYIASSRRARRNTYSLSRTPRKPNNPPPKKNKAKPTMRWKGWESGSVVKSACCPSGEPKFNPQHPQSPGNWLAPGSSIPLWPLPAHTDTQVKN